jgi:Outer membrane protein beta-barrel family
VDYSLPIDTAFKIEMGAKTSFATIDNDLQFSRSGEISKAESNIFLYKENINAGYVSINKTLGKLEFNAGLRAEQTIATGTSENKKVLDRNYLQWFPNASLLYRLNKQMGIQASYSKRVNRPGFDQQNPFTNFIDSLTYTRGNPTLLPEIAHSGQLAVVFEGQPFASVEYSRTDNVIVENAPQLEGTKTFTTAQNLANKYDWIFQLNFPIKLGKWLDGFGGNQAIYNEYNADYLGTKYAASRWHWLAYWGVTAKLPKDIKVELNGFYMTKFLEEFLTIGSLNGFNIAASKSFWDKRGRLSLNFNDVFYGQKTTAHIDFKDVTVDFKQRRYSRNLRMTFSYQFGNTKVKNARNRKTGSESETSRVKVE